MLNNILIGIGVWWLFGMICQIPNIKNRKYPYGWIYIKMWRKTKGPEYQYPLSISKMLHTLLLAYIVYPLFTPPILFAMMSTTVIAMFKIKGTVSRMKNPDRMNGKKL